jgi:hypothetical protein
MLFGLSCYGLLVILALLSTIAIGGEAQTPAIPSGRQHTPVADGAESSLPPDLSIALVETTMKAHPVAASLGKWGYIPALYLYGEMLVYRRTGDARYLNYVRTGPMPMWMSKAGLTTICTRSTFAKEPTSGILTSI